MTVRDKKILLGVTGSIAAYKSAELVRRLKDAGAEVQVVLTRSATALIGPLTFQALSGRPVRSELFDAEAEAAMSHIELARWADLVLVAPASASFIARLAHGLADDLLSTLCLATAAPVALAPAMNRNMWAHPATRENCRTLEERGVQLLGPGDGAQACGEMGEGRMLEPQEIIAAIGEPCAREVLSGLRVMITAGPTREPLDPVRFISNRSSGRMGFALAKAAQEAGARVHLISGPVTLAASVGVKRTDVETAQQMSDAVMSGIDEQDIFIACAAVADYRPKRAADSKIKKSEASLSIEVISNPDILTQVTALSDPPFTVGFAAETENLHSEAIRKLRAKKLDMIAANLVGNEIGFDTSENSLSIFWDGGQLELPKTDKLNLARQLIALIAERHAARRRPETDRA